VGVGSKQHLHRWIREHDVVVRGGAFGGLQAVSNLRRAPVEVTLVDRRNVVAPALDRGRAGA
jgi:2-polyprenyl-6-methoxyphenol hydroxylase-like FAD-dependent oxidoreductase